MEWSRESNAQFDEFQNKFFAYNKLLKIFKILTNLLLNNDEANLQNLQIYKSTSSISRSRNV